MRTTWASLFPLPRVSLPKPYAALAGKLLDEAAFEAASEKLETGVDVDLEGTPATLYVIGGGVRLVFAKRTLGRSVDEHGAAVAAILTKKWGTPFEAKKSHMWLDEPAGLRARLYTSRVDGVFLELCGYSPFLPLVRKLIETAGGAKQIPFLGDKRKDVKKTFPAAHDNDSNLAVSVGLTELGTVPGYWHFEIDARDRITMVQIVTDVAASSRNIPAYVKPLFAGQKPTKDGPATIYRVGDVALRVWKAGVGTPLV